MWKHGKTNDKIVFYDSELMELIFVIKASISVVLKEFSTKRVFQKMMGHCAKCN